MTKVDAHHHFIDPDRFDYPWIGGPYRGLLRPFAAEDLRPKLDACGIDKTVLVQTISDEGETRRLCALAAETDVVAGVVGWVDLTAADVADALARLRSEPGGRYLVGIRHQVHDEDDPEWIVRDDALRGLSAVGAAGLAYDLLLRPRELPAAVRAVRELPDVRFVIDHLAKPRIAEGVVDDWADHMKALAAESQVFCKLSGMVTEADWRSWSVSDLEPYAASVLEWFGEDRVIFGSDWPVCLVAASYEQVYETATRMIGGASESGRDAILGGNAVRAYRLEN